MIWQLIRILHKRQQGNQAARSTATRATVKMAVVAAVHLNMGIMLPPHFPWPIYHSFFSWLMVESVEFCTVKMCFFTIVSVINFALVFRWPSRELGWLVFTPHLATKVNVFAMKVNEPYNIPSLTFVWNNALLRTFRCLTKYNCLILQVVLRFIYISIYPYRALYLSSNSTFSFPHWCCQEASWHPMSSSPYQSSDSFMDPIDLQSWWYPQAGGNYPDTLDPVFIDGVYNDTSRMDTPVFGRDKDELQTAEPKVRWPDNPVRLITGHWNDKQTLQLSENECGHYLEKNESYEEPRNQLGRGSLDSSQTPILHPSYEPSGNERTRTQKGPRKRRRRPSDVTSSIQNTKSKPFHGNDQLLSSSAGRQCSQNDQRVTSYGSAQRSTKSKFTKEQSEPMLSWYQDHRSNPYPSPEEKKELASQAGIEIKQLETWFINKRKRSNSRNFKQGLRSRESTSSLERWRSTSPKDDSALKSTITNLQNDDRPTRFHRRTIINSEYNAVQPVIANSRERISLGGAISSTDPQVSSLGSDNERRRTRKQGKHIYPSEFPPERQGNKKFQCTWCNQGFESRDSWKRHEKSSCAPQEQYICMDGGPLLLDNDGHRNCAFCGIRDPSEHHINKEHNISTCSQLNKPQVFYRPDGARRHMRDVHRASLSASWPNSWVVPVDRHGLEPNLWCGFCKTRRENREDRFKHVAKHFEDTTTQFDMTRWTPYVESFTEDVLKFNQTGYHDIYFPDVP